MFILSFHDKVKNKHLMFKSYVNNNENQSSLINNENESEFLNESFEQKWNIETFELAHENRVNLILEDDISSEMLTREAHVNLLIEEHRERLFCYITQLKCDLILRNDWLQIHNFQIDQKLRHMTFFQNCEKRSCVKTKIIVETIENRVETIDVNIQSLSSRRFSKLMNKVDNQITCFYSKEKFNDKMERYQKTILTILKKIKSKHHDQFMLISLRWWYISSQYTVWCSLLIELNTRFWVIVNDDLYVESVNHVIHVNSIRSDYLSTSLSRLI